MVAANPITLQIGQAASKEHAGKLKPIIIPHNAATDTITLPIPLDMSDPCPIEMIILCDPTTPVFRTFDIKVEDVATLGCQQNDLSGTVVALYFQVTNATTLTFAVADRLTANGFAIVVANFEQ